jgi:hypothetical protein
MDEILARLDDHRDKPDERSTSKLWQQFVEDYIPEDGPFNDNLAPGGNGSRFQNRSFADGGYLNNKPFSYAIEEIGARMGDLPSERKLVYVEPSPESLRDTPPPENKPEFIDNSIDAAFSLPGYQTIREDLWRVVERNRLVTRVQEIVSQSENELKTFAENQLSEIIKKLDPSFRAYEGLRVKAVTDELALMATRALGGDDSGDDLRAIYYLTRAWREEKTEGGSPLDGDSFLNQYDLSFRIRRFRLLLTKLDLLHIGGEKARTVLTTAFAPGPIPDETDLRAG